MALSATIRQCRLVRPGFRKKGSNLRRISQSQKTQLVLNMAMMNTHKEYMKQYSDVVHHYQWKNYDEWTEKYSGIVNPEAHASLRALPLTRILNFSL